MKKLLLVVTVAMGMAGCTSASRQRVRFVEAPDPVVGDLRCAAPRLSILEALYTSPEEHPARVCEAAGS